MNNQLSEVQRLEHRLQYVEAQPSELEKKYSRLQLWLIVIGCIVIVLNFRLLG